MNRISLNVYFIMGTQNSLTPLDTLEKALQAGISYFQFREKGTGCLLGAAYEAFAIACQKLCRSYHVPFIVNDDIELAIKIDADGIHIGQADMDIIEVHRRIASNKIIGISVYNEQELAHAVTNGADYVGIGPLFPTKSKKDAKPPLGLDFIQKAREQYPNMPIVGIGGIDDHNASAVRLAGADGVAVISAICESTDIRKTIHLLNEAGNSH